MTDEKTEDLKVLAEIDNIKKALTLKEQSFVDNYLRGMTPTEAFIDAGIETSDQHDATSKARKLLMAPRVRLYIDKLQRYVATRSIMTLDAIDQRLSDISMSNLPDMLKDWGGDPRDLSEKLTAPEKAAIKKLKFKQLTTDDDMTCELVEIDLVDQLKAMDMLIKRRGGYEEKVNHNITGGVKVLAFPGNNGRGPKDE